MHFILLLVTNPSVTSAISVVAQGLHLILSLNNYMHFNWWFETPRQGLI